MRRSSQTVTYQDTVNLSTKTRIEAERKLSGARICGAHSLEGLTHEVEVARRLEKMLKKGAKTKETDMLELFNQIQ